MILGWLAMIIFACHASTHMVGAGDTWVALACGRHFINHGVDTNEPFSANSHRAGPTEEDVKKWPELAQWITGKVGLDTVKYWHPTGWVNQNWLTHVIFYWLTHLSPVADADTWSFNTLVYWKFAIYITAIICVYYTGRILGVNPALSAVFACFAMFTGRSYFDIRPAGFSNLLVAVFLLILVLSTYRNKLYIWLIVPIAIFWCNVHGGYIYVFIMLAPFVALNLLASFFPKWFVPITRKHIYHTIGAGITTFVAVIIFNPFHLTNLTHTFAISLSEHAEMWRTVNEWHPAFEWSNPVGTAFPFLVMLILSIGLAVFWLFSRLLKPKLLTAPKNELEAQKKQFTILSKIFGCVMAVFAAWIVFISLSFLDLTAVSFFICAVFVAILLVSVYGGVHFIYLTVLLTLIALWSTDPNVGYTGRYIYPFVLLPAYVILHTIASLFSEKIETKPKNIIFVLAAAIAALVLMTVMINPFKFESSVWNVKQFFELHRIWHPRYERNPTFTYTYLFSTLYIINILSIIVWFTMPYLRRIFGQQPNQTAEQPETQTYELPKIDLSIIAIAALTIYMAIRSRRFIPIAAIAACPVIAMFIDQITRAISATRNFHRRNRLIVLPMSHGMQYFFTLVAAAVVLALGIGWGLKFKRVYLDPWPTDAKLNSVFIRMTASDAKPFYACRFIKDNKLKGKMFNYWTEGGFIAWGQEPDPNTGKTPLQLFMDGRAQAAYEPSAYRIWSEIMSGGPVVQRAKIRGHKLTPDDYVKVGQWVDEQMKKRNAWAVLMPSTVQGQSPMVIRGLERLPTWSLVFYSNKQKLYVDISTPQGKELFEGIFNGKTLYPDEFSKNLIIAHQILLLGKEQESKKRGLDYAVKAFKLLPSQAPMLKIMSAVKYNDLVPHVVDFCQNYVDDFIENKELYVKQHSYHNRMSAALIATDYLGKIAKSQKNEKLAEFYDTKKKEFYKEGKSLFKTKRW